MSKLSFLWVYKRAGDDSRSSRIFDLNYVLRKFIEEKNHLALQTVTSKLAKICIRAYTVGIKVFEPWTKPSLKVDGAKAVPDHGFPNLKLRFKVFPRKNFGIKC